MQNLYSNLQKHFFCICISYNIRKSSVWSGNKSPFTSTVFQRSYNQNPNNLLLDEWISKFLHCIITIDVSGQKSPQIEENRSKRQDPGMRFRMDQEIKKLLFFT